MQPLYVGRGHGDGCQHSMQKSGTLGVRNFSALGQNIKPDPSSRVFDLISHNGPIAVLKEPPYQLHGCCAPVAHLSCEPVAVAGIMYLVEYGLHFQSCTWKMNMHTQYTQTHNLHAHRSLSCTQVHAQGSYATAVQITIQTRCGSNLSRNQLCVSFAPFVCGSSDMGICM